MHRALLASLLGCLVSGCVVLPGDGGAGEGPRRTQSAYEMAGPVGPPPPPPQPVALATFRERDVRDVYVDLLGREPSRDEVREWRYRSQREPVSRDAIAAAVRDSREFRALSPEILIRRAYWEFHHVEPSDSEMRFYRRKFLDEHWSAGQVRRSIAERHPESRPQPAPPSQPGRRRGGGGQDRHARDDRRPGDAAGFRSASANSPEAIVRRAYDDLLERAPDPAGLEHYVKAVRQGASEEEIRRRIRESEEYRVALPDAKTRRAYREILGRDPDEGGLQHYRKLIVDKGWTEDDVKNDLRKSAEYRSRQR